METEKKVYRIIPGLALAVLFVTLITAEVVNFSIINSGANALLQNPLIAIIASAAMTFAHYLLIYMVLTRKVWFGYWIVSVLNSCLLGHGIYYLVENTNHLIGLTYELNYTHLLAVSIVTIFIRYYVCLFLLNKLNLRIF